MPNVKVITSPGTWVWPSRIKENGIAGVNVAADAGRWALGQVTAELRLEILRRLIPVLANGTRVSDVRARIALVLVVALLEELANSLACTSESPVRATA